MLNGEEPQLIRAIVVVYQRLFVELLLLVSVQDMSTQQGGKK